MPTTTSYSSMGAKLQGNNSTYQDINQLKNVQGPSTQWNLADITTLSSTNATVEKRTITKDASTVSISLVYAPENTMHEWLRARNADGVLAGFKEILTDAGAGEFGFSAYMTRFELGFDTGNVIMVNGELTCSGDVTFTP